MSLMKEYKDQKITDEEYEAVKELENHGTIHTLLAENDHVIRINYILNENASSPPYRLEQFPNLKYLMVNGGGNACFKRFNLAANKALEKVQIKCTSIKELEGLGELSLLQDLDLDVNNIESLNGIDHCTRLKRLTAICNQLTEVPYFGNLEYLTSVELAKNRIARIGNTLENTQNLTYLGLSDNLIEEIEGLDCLSKLRTLDLARNRLRTVKNLDGLVSLEDLYLDENTIFHIARVNTPKLKKLSMKKNRIEMLRGLDDLHELEELYLGENNIEHIENLENLRKLRVLQLYGNLLTSTLGLSNLVNIEKLDLAGNMIRDVEGLGPLVKLKRLRLTKNQLEVVPHLRNPVLTQLYIGINNITKLENLEDLPALKEIGFIYFHSKLLRDSPHRKDNEREIERLNKKGIKLVWMD